MNIYLLKKKETQPEGNDPWHYTCDIVYGFVVAARYEAEARYIASLKAQYEGEKAWINPEHTTCEGVGVTYSFATPQVILCNSLKEYDEG